MRHDASARQKETFPEDPVSQVRPTKRMLAFDPGDELRSTLLPPPMPPVPPMPPAPAPAPPRPTSSTLQGMLRSHWTDIVQGAAWALVAVSVGVVVFALAH